MLTDNDTTLIILNQLDFKDVYRVCHVNDDLKKLCFSDITCKNNYNVMDRIIHEPVDAITTIKIDQLIMNIWKGKYGSAFDGDDVVYRNTKGFVLKLGDHDQDMEFGGYIQFDGPVELTKQKLFDTIKINLNGKRVQKDYDRGYYTALMGFHKKKERYYFITGN